MSQIFDALLRSETERAGKGSEAEVVATELLRRVEIQAAAKWVSAGHLSQREVETLLDFPAASPGAALDEPVQPQTLPTDGGSGWLDQFKPLLLSPAAGGRLVCLTEKESPTAEAFRLLGVRLRDLRRAQPLKKVLITSTVPREGKSTVAANLACTLAHKNEERTLLVEGDVRRPSLSQMFDLGNRPGLCELLQEKVSLQESIYRLERADYWILPAGSAPNTPLELLQSGKLPALMDQLTSWFDWIIIDSPPILPLADTSVWTRMVDGILLVTRQGITEKQQLERGLQAIEPGKLIGALLNCSKASTYSSYYYRSSTVS